MLLVNSNSSIVAIRIRQKASQRCLFFIVVACRALFLGRSLALIGIIPSYSHCTIPVWLISMSKTKKRNLSDTAVSNKRAKEPGLYNSEVCSIVISGLQSVAHAIKVRMLCFVRGNAKSGFIAIVQAFPSPVLS